MLQEQLLSPQVLTFASGEVSWDCSALRASESYPEGCLMDGCDTEKYFAGLWEPKRSVVSIGDGLNPISPEQANLSWQMIVEQYSQRSITKATNILIASAGITEAHGKILGDDLSAGLWGGQYLWRSLLWSADHTHQKAGLKRFAGPTWS